MSEGFPPEFLSGAIAAGYLTLGLFFLRFWRRTRDMLFASFAAAFWLLAISQALATLTRSEEIETGWAYLVRLAAFVVIIVAIVHKNMDSTRRP